jgi:hypothetical protein
VLGVAACSRFSSFSLIFSPSLPLIIVLLGFGFMVTFSSILVSSLRFSPCCCVSVLRLPWYTVGLVISGNSLVGLIVSELQGSLSSGWGGLGSGSGVQG